jgi:hypothetical protein
MIPEASRPVAQASMSGRTDSADDHAALMTFGVDPDDTVIKRMFSPSATPASSIATTPDPYECWHARRLSA